ncbi:MAG: hypothetical protein RL087_983, partial [Pseudomonadota bacterium]
MHLSMNLPQALPRFLRPLLAGAAAVLALAGSAWAQPATGAAATAQAAAPKGPP